MSSFISEVKGRLPTFGYPLIPYSPKRQSVTLYDENVWKHEIVSDGKAIKDLSNDEFRLRSTADLKIELTEKVDAENNRRAFRRSKSPNYPAGLKYHMYKDVQNETYKVKKNHWQGLYKLMGL